MNEALRLGARAVFTMDADRSHDPLELPKLFEGLKQYDVVLGSRYVGGVRFINWPLRRVFLSAFANRYVRTILGFPHRDCTSGFRGYRREVLEAIHWPSIHSTGYAFLVELLYAALQTGHPVGEIPITFTERRAGQSKMSGRVIWEAVWRVWALFGDHWWSKLLQRAPRFTWPRAVAEKGSRGLDLCMLAEKTPRWISGAMVLVLASALALRTVNLGYASLWNDEIAEACVRDFPWSGVPTAFLKLSILASPLDYYVAKAVLSFTQDEFWLRMPSVLWGIASVWLLFSLVARQGFPLPALFAAVFLATSPFHARYSRQLRYYSPLVFFTIAVAATYLEAVRTDKARNWIAFALTGLLGLYFHLFVAFTLCAVALLEMARIVSRWRAKKGIGRNVRWFLFSTDVPYRG
jgi:hypothetical protein